MFQPDCRTEAHRETIRGRYQLTPGLHWAIARHGHRPVARGLGPGDGETLSPPQCARE
jgi:hypothetical protein